MVHPPPQFIGSSWPIHQSPANRLRVLLLTGILLLGFTIIVSIKMVAFETPMLEEKGLTKRQFQLGSLLGEVIQEAISPTGNERTLDIFVAKPGSTTDQTTTNESTLVSVPSKVSTSVLPKGTATAHDSSISAQPNMASGTGALRGDPGGLFQALADAVKTVIREGDKSRSPASSLNPQENLLSDILRPSPLQETSAASTPLSKLSKSPLPPSNPQTSSNNSPVPSLGILGGLSGGNLLSRGIHARQAIPAPGSPPPGNGTFLSCLSNIIAEISGVDPAAAARLIDAVLEALHVDSSAIASVIPQVANKAAVNAADLLPFIIPAVAAAMGESLPVRGPQSTLGLEDTLNMVLQQATTLINGLSKTIGNGADPSLQSVINQLARIISAAANYLNQPLCAISHSNDGITYQVVAPCSSNVDPQVPTNVPSSNPPGSASGLPPLASGSESVVTLVSAIAYLPSTGQSIPPSPTPENSDSNRNTANQGTLPSSSRPPDTSVNNSVHPSSESRLTPTPTRTSWDEQTPNAPTRADGNTLVQPGCPIVVLPSCPAVDACPKCPLNPCSSSGSHQPSGLSDPSVGPCPGRGFKCAECPDGWFCPPQETPAHAVPCGLGWPCYDCSSHYFCGPEQPPPPPPGSDSSGGSRSNTPSETVSGIEVVPTNSADSSLANWSYLGCFQDAISRTLVGGKPIDYVQGNTSPETCIEHCMNRGYRFAGTENGKECWCGISIRDDAIRLPESQCGTPCQGSSGHCGGNWVISVFMCLDDSELEPGSMKKASFRSMAQLVESFKSKPESHIDKRLAASVPISAR